MKLGQTLFDLFLIGRNLHVISSGWQMTDECRILPIKLVGYCFFFAVISFLSNQIRNRFSNSDPFKTWFLCVSCFCTSLLEEHKNNTQGELTLHWNCILAILHKSWNLELYRKMEKIYPVVAALLLSIKQILYDKIVFLRPFLN